MPASDLYNLRVGGQAVDTAHPAPVADAAVLAAVTAKPSTGTMSKVDASVTVVTLLAANAARKGASIYFDGPAVLYAGLSATAPTAALFTTKLGDGYPTYFEAPAGYTGAIRGIWSAAVGSAFVTELV